MKFIFLYVGKTEKGYLEEGVNHFTSRIMHYVSIEEVVIPEAKSWKRLPAAERVRAEGKAILEHIVPGDQAILLDEKGKELTSKALATYLEKKMVSGAKRIVFIIGGAYGFSDDIYKLVPSKLSLSKLTFSHQMVRLFLAEQVYRAMTILRNEPYHNN